LYEEFRVSRVVDEDWFLLLARWQNTDPKTTCKLTISSTPVTHLLSTHLPAHIDAFHPIVTRDFRPPKPSPAGILHIAKAWGVEASSETRTEASTSTQQHSLPLIMVGDSIDDIIAGYDAGALTVLVKSPGKEDLERDERTHVIVERLDELIGLLESGIEAR
jgi:phosphoglycolate phosphatase-like HAD superfamily hydrolase